MAQVTHRTLTGRWELCEVPETCKLVFHFPDITPAEMTLMPERVLWELCMVLDPPQVNILGGGHLRWERVVNGQAVLHREYDLPALFLRDGRVEWWHLGERHRAGFRPAVITPEGAAQWWCQGQLTHEVGGTAQTVRHYAPFYAHGHPHAAYQTIR